MTPAMREYIMENEPCTAEQIAQAFGITRQSVYEHRQKRKIYVAAWARGKRGHAVALYRLGNLANKPRPDGMPASVRSRAYRERNPAILRSRRPNKQLASAGMWAGLIK